MKKSILFFLTTVTFSIVLWAIFRHPLAYAAGIPLAVALWGGLKTISFEKSAKTTPWFFLALILPVFYSTGFVFFGIFENFEILGLILAFLPLFIGAFMEEIGWRGFLFKELKKYGWLKMNLVIGLMWAAWHLPAILSGYYSVALSLELYWFFINVILLSFLLGFFRQKTAGILAPTLLHASHNLFGSTFMEVTWLFTLILLLILAVVRAWKAPIKA